VAIGQVKNEILNTMDDACWRYILSNESGPSKLGLGKIWKKIRAKQGKDIA